MATRSNLNRRDFLIGGVSFALVSLGLPGCGGGGVGGGASGSNMTTAKGTVKLPSGTSVSLTTLSIGNAFASRPVGSGGTFSAPVAPNIPTLVHVSTLAAGVLFGFVDPTSGANVLDSTACAVAMLYFAIGGFGVPSVNRATLLGLIRQDAATAPLATVIAARIATNPYALEDGDAQLSAALKTAFDKIVNSNGGAVPGYQSAPSAKAAPAASAIPSQAIPVQLLVQPSGEIGGIEVLQDSKTTGVLATNHYRRFSKVAIYQVGEQASTPGAQRVDYPLVQSLTKKHIDLPSTVAPSVLGTLAGLFTGHTAYTPISTPVFPLAMVSGTSKTFFEIVVFGSANLKPEPAFFNDAKYANEVALWRIERRLLNLRSFLMDYAVQILGEIWGIVDFARDAALFEKLVANLNAVNDAKLQKLLNDVGDGSLASDVTIILDLVAVGGAVASQLIQAFAGLISSPSTYRTFLAAQPLASASLSIVKKMLLAPMNVVNVILGLGDIGALYHDLNAADAADVWEATLFQPKLSLSPSTAKMIPGTNQNFAIAVPGITGTIDSVWTLSGATFAYLNDNVGHYGPQVSTTATKVTLESTPSDVGSCTLTVTASQGTVNLGSATAQITFSPPKQVQVAGSFQVNQTFYTDSGFPRCHTEADVLVPGEQGAISYLVHCDGFNDPYSYGTKIDFGFDPRNLPTDGSIVNLGGSYERPISSIDGPASGAGADKANMLARFGGMKVVATVTVPS